MWAYFTLPAKLATEDLDALDSGSMTLRSGVDKLKGSMATHPVQLLISPAFAMAWLMPRIQQ